MSVVTPSSPSNRRPDEAGPQPQVADPSGDAQPPLRIRYRIRFAKTGLLKWISHRDLARLWERLLRRARLQLSMTEGFHPKPRVSFPSALALGVEGLDEVVEIELAEELTPTQLLQRLQNDNQPGLKIHRVCRLPEQFGKAQLSRSDYTITMVDSVEPARVDSAIETLMSKSRISIERKNKRLTFDVNSQIASLQRCGSVLHLSLAASDTASLRPSDVLDLLGFGRWVEEGSSICRVGVVLQRELANDDPAVTASADETEPNHPGRNRESRNE